MLLWWLATGERPGEAGRLRATMRPGEVDVHGMRPVWRAATPHGAMP